MKARTINAGILCLSLPLLGAVAAATVASRVVSGGTGWDQVKTAGVMLLGGLAGLLAAVRLLRRLSDEVLGYLAFVMSLLAIGLIVFATVPSDNLTVAS